MFLLSKVISPMIWSVQDKHWQLGIFSSTRKTSPSDSEPLLVILENDWSFNQTPLAILVNEFLIRVMQYFLERSMGLVQPILWISMYYIRFMNLFFAHSTLVAVQSRLWFCCQLARSLSIYGITQLKCKYIIYSHAQASNWLGERS